MDIRCYETSFERSLWSISNSPAFVLGYSLTEAYFMSVGAEKLVPGNSQKTLALCSLSDVVNVALQTSAR